MLEQLYDTKENMNCFTLDFSCESIIECIQYIEKNISKDIQYQIVCNARRLAFKEETHFNRIKKLLSEWEEFEGNISTNYSSKVTSKSTVTATFEPCSTV